MIRKHSTRGGHGETRPLRCGMPPLARHLAVQSLPNKRIKALHLVMKRAVERAAPLFERVIGIQAGPFDSVLQEETSREVAQVGLYADCCLARQPKKISSQQIWPTENFLVSSYPCKRAAEPSHWPKWQAVAQLTAGPCRLSVVYKYVATLPPISIFFPFFFSSCRHILQRIISIVFDSLLCFPT